MGIESECKCVNESGQEWKGIGGRGLNGMLLGGVEVGVALFASGASESHRASKIDCRSTRNHLFLNMSCSGR